MCGFCGIYSFQDSEYLIDRELIKKMNDALIHRGPDEEGYYFDKNIGLGHRRLSIIDIAGGSQPIHNEDRSIWVVFNGEIYNYKILTDYLKTKGHEFYTKTDTEILVHLYEELDVEFVKKLRGIFAFALWDQNKQRLILVRDHVGVKPLFYRLHRGIISFASEIKSLLQDSEYSRELNLEALELFLSLSYVSGPGTIFKGIERLLPGHLLIIENSKIERERYWQIKFNPDFGKSFEYFKERLTELLKESIALELMSEVPLGVFLSSGLDSGTLVALMSECTGSPINTFSVGYSESSEYFNELPHAKMVAEKYNTIHREFIVSPKIEDIIEDIIKSFDEPFADPAIIPSYYISKLAKEFVTVALSGLGGDELFGGYERYLGCLLSLMYDKVPELLRKNLVPGMVGLIPGIGKDTPTLSRVKRFVDGTMLPEGLRYYSYLSCFNHKEKLELINPDLNTRMEQDRAEKLVRLFYNEDSYDPLHRAINVDMHVYLPDCALAFADRLSMMHSMELRVPFLDHVMLEFGSTIPANFKIRFFKKKYLLRKTMEHRLPNEILEKRKTGFASPIVQWFRGSLRSFVEEVLSDENVKRRGYFNPKVVKNILNEHFQKRRNLQRQIFVLLTFEVWHRIYIGD